MQTQRLVSINFLSHTIDLLLHLQLLEHWAGNRKQNYHRKQFYHVFHLKAYGMTQIMMIKPTKRIIRVGRIAFTSLELYYLEHLVLSTSMYHLECDSHVPWQLHLHLNRSFATSRTHWFTSISSSLTYSKIEIIFKTIAQACKVLYISHSCSIPAADTFNPSRLRGASLSPIRGWVWLLTVIIMNSFKIF